SADLPYVSGRAQFAPESDLLSLAARPRQRGSAPSYSNTTKRVLGPLDQARNGPHLAHSYIEIRPRCLTRMPSCDTSSVPGTASTAPKTAVPIPKNTATSQPTLLPLAIIQDPAAVKTAEPTRSRANF